MESIYGWIGLLLGFSGLIFIHELGHFLLAKWNGVQVHVFSIGMGPYLLSFTHKGTVYALSMIPLGGYVKMMGQDDLNADVSANKDPRDFRNKRPGQKAAILAAGAAFNIITTIVIFSYCYFSGMHVPSPTIGYVPKDKPLAKAVLLDGKDTPAELEKGDRIERVNDIKVKSYFDMIMEVTAQSGADPIVLYVKRKNKKDAQGNTRYDYVQVNVEHDKRQGVPNIGLGGDTAYEGTELLPLGFDSEMCVFIAKDPEEDTAAGKSPTKFKKGDRIVRLEDHADKEHPVLIKLDSPHALARLASESNGKEYVFIIERSGHKELLNIPLAAQPYKDDGSFRFGIVQSVLYRVTNVDPGSEAAKAGLQKDDLVRGFDPDNPSVHPWKSGKLIWTKNLDDTKPLKAALTVSEKRTGELFHQDYVVEDEYKVATFGDAMTAAWDDTRRYTIVMFKTVRNLVTNKVSAKNLAGPLGIGQSIFTVASKHSFNEYLWWLAFISLNLGVMQMLPIPLLDGFHLVMVGVEKLKGSAVSARVQEKFMYAGMAIIGSLLVLVMWTDISRFFGR